MDGWAAAGPPLEGAVTLDASTQFFLAPVTGLYLVTLVVGFVPDPNGIRVAGAVLGSYCNIYSGMIGAVVPGLGGNMVLSESGAAWIESGEAISPYAAQDSGIALGTGCFVAITQITVT